MSPLSRVGRPIAGVERRSMEIKIRMEPYLLKQMDAACQELKMSRSAFVRYAIEQLLKVVRQHGRY